MLVADCGPVFFSFLSLRSYLVFYGIISYISIKKVKLVYNLEPHRKDWEEAQSCRKWSNRTPNPEKTGSIAFPPALHLLSGPLFLSLERWSRGCAELGGQWRRLEQRSRRIYHWTACQGDYWIKITIWHFSFSVLAQWTEGKLLQPSVPSSTLLIASLAPLQPLREKSFCQNITQSTDFFPPFRWSSVYLTVEEGCHNHSFSAFYHHHTLHQCVSAKPWVLQDYTLKIEENRHSVWIIFGFL